MPLRDVSTLTFSSAVEAWRLLSSSEFALADLDVNIVSVNLDALKFCSGDVSVSIDTGTKTIERHSLCTEWSTKQVYKNVGAK